MRHAFRLTFDSPRRLLACWCGPLYCGVILSWFWLRPHWPWVWRDRGASPMLRVGPVVVVWWQAKGGSR